MTTTNSSRRLRPYIRMYRPHEAREDTVLFPALRSVVSPNEFDAMGEDFEKDERQKFGEDGFEKVVSQVAGLERGLGIHDLRGRFGTRMSGAQLIEQRLSFFQIERIEASGEPAVDQSERSRASSCLPWSRRAMLIIGRSSQDFACCPAQGRA